MAVHFPRLVGMVEQVAHVDSSPEERKAGEKLGDGSCQSLGWKGTVILQCGIGLCLLFLSCLRTYSWEIWGFHTAVFQFIRALMIQEAT